MLNAARVLDRLDYGVLVLSRDLELLYANARWTSWLGVPVERGVPFATLLGEIAGPSETEMRATLTDGRSRNFVEFLRAPADGGAPRRIVCGVHLTDDALVLEAREENDGERAALSGVARQLAEATDIGEVLRTLCDIATRQ